MDITLTKKQETAYSLITENRYANVFLFGGARSGKSYLIALLIILAAWNTPGTRALVARLRFKHARTSIWQETIIPILEAMNKKTAWEENRSDRVITFWNGSQIWLGGFDEKERVEKLLGHEYAIIYFNEISQISYDAVELGLTRLAQNVPGLKNTAYFDCNPPSPLHWSHKLFIEKVDPKNPKNRLGNAEDYFSMLMNPKDNEENLSPDFFRRLENLSDRARRRMLLGEWVKAEGTIFERFDREHIIKEEDLPDKFEAITGGIDFGLNMAAVRIGWAGDRVYVIDDHGAYDTTTREFNAQLKTKWGEDYPETMYADPSGGERLQEVSNAQKANNSVEEGIDCINTLIAQNRFRVCEKATNVLNEIMDYRREIVTTRLGVSEKIVKMNDHFMDAMRYSIFSPISRPLQIFL